MRKPEVYDHIGKVLQTFKEDGYGWITRSDLAERFSKMFPEDIRKLDKHDVRPYIPGMLSHYMGDNEEPKRPVWAPKVEREKCGSDEGYTFA